MADGALTLILDDATVARLADIGADCTVGPYAVLEPGTQLKPGTRTGPFSTGEVVGGSDV